jgi:hypothetical protein
VPKHACLLLMAITFDYSKVKVDVWYPYQKELNFL